MKHLKKDDCFLKALAFDRRSILADRYAKAALETTSGASGGYTLPVEYSLAFLDSFAENSIIYPRATVLPMTTTQLDCPVPDTGTAPTKVGQSSLFGNMTFKWQIEQNVSLPESEPLFRLVTLTARDLVGELIISNQFLNDIGAEGEEVLIRFIGRACAWYEEWAYVNGIGVGGDDAAPTGIGSIPLVGVINAPGTIASTRTTGNEIAQADVVLMASHMLPFGWNKAIWMVSPSALPQLFAITGFQPNGHMETTDMGVAGFMYGRPVYVSDKCAALGSKGDLLFFDPTLYAIGDRQQVTIDASGEPLFRTNQTVFRVVRRIDAKPIFGEVITLPDTSDTVSPFVVLAA